MTVSPTLSTRWRLVASFPLPCTPRWLLVFFEADCSNAAKIVKSFAKLCKNELGVRYFKRLSIHCLVAPLRPAPYNQEAYDAECAALARALEEASRRNMIPDRVTIFSDAQAAIRRMASDEPAPARSTRSRPEGTSRNCGRRDRASPSRSGGVQRTRGWKETRRPTNGPNSRRKSQTPAGWNGYTTWTGRRRAPCPSPDRSPISGGRSTGKSGQKRGSGLEAGPPSRNIVYRTPTNRTRRSLGAPRGLPRGSTS